MLTSSSPAIKCRRKSVFRKGCILKYFTDGPENINGTPFCVLDRKNLRSLIPCCTQESPTTQPCAGWWHPYGIELVSTHPLHSYSQKIARIGGFSLRLFLFLSCLSRNRGPLSGGELVKLPIDEPSSTFSPSTSGTSCFWESGYDSSGDTTPSIQLWSSMDGCIACSGSSLSLPLSDLLTSSALGTSTRSIQSK